MFYIKKINEMASQTIFTEFLSALGVKHTATFSNKQFRDMDFKSLFGFSVLLDKYNIPNAAWKVPQTGSVEQIKTPFIAYRASKFDIVTNVSKGNVTFIEDDSIHTSSITDFEKDFGGVVLTAVPNSKSIEPDYVKHKILDYAAKGLNVVMIIAFIAVLAYLYITRKYYDNAAITVLMIVDLCGLAVTSMLMLKSVNVHLKVADNVCGILQEGGCDHILAMNVSKFFGLFGWSEVGLGYFLVSTGALMLFPDYIHYLALANLCCLPFTVWSIWYQKFRAKHWCTLCVITQTLLWCQFICYICGGFEKDFDLCRWQPWILLMCYIFAVLILNKIAQLLNSSNN